MNIDRTRQSPLSTCGHTSKDVLTMLGTYSVPLLEQFQIDYRAYRGMSVSLPDNLFTGHYLALRELALINCKSSWSFPPLNSLESVEISNVIPGLGQCPSMLQLISLLKTTPTLEDYILMALFPPLFQDCGWILLLSNAGYILTNVFEIMRRTFSPETRTAHSVPSSLIHHVHCDRLEWLTILKLNAPENAGATSIPRMLSSKRPGLREEDLPRLYFPALRRLSITRWDFERFPDNNGEPTSELLW